MDKLLANKITDICDKDYFYLKSFKNVIGVGLGYKVINGKDTGELSVHVLVHNKTSEIDKSNFIPKTYMGIKTDVIEIGEQAQKSLKEKIRPLVAGYGISKQNLKEAGTIGCIVTRDNPYGVKDYYILTNNHVIADLTRGEIGIPLVQPGGIDGGESPRDIVARLSEFIPLKFHRLNPKPENFVDAAIGKIIKPSLVQSKEIALVGKITGISKAVIGERIKKVGRTSGLTMGEVTTINTTIEISYGGRFKTPFLFKGLTLAKLQLDQGDSGSIVLNEKNEAIGQAISSSSQNITTFADMETVLTALNVELYI
ncbi:trypsin-like peptidase domain-containing protein [Clostridium tarantellae]|uniref:Serine protease n=1 Tax=Clostridium tarantellae TaxID=39493 RepID=A0A6I1MQG0_9CLOT|nr:trypsin-like peptidase domain-containing protein [Clostridium tarantellae]MPQ45020.1 hypothetical protein [Clostridium tarantellae]